MIFIPGVFLSYFFGRSTADDDQCRMTQNADLLQIFVTIYIEFVLSWLCIIRREFILKSGFNLLPELRVRTWMNQSKGAGCLGLRLKMRCWRRGCEDDGNQQSN